MEIREEKRETETVSIREVEGISIFLENQEEIDELFAIINFTPVMDALNSKFVGELWEGLEEHNTGGYIHFHNKISAGVVRRTP